MAYSHFIYDIICIRSNERQTFSKSKIKEVNLIKKIFGRFWLLQFKRGGRDRFMDLTDQK